MEQADDQAREIAELRDRLSRLSQASLRINESLDFDTVLQGVLDSACSLTGARYGVITLLDESGQVQDFVTSVHSGPDAVPWRCLFHPACTTFGIHNVSTQNSEAINRGSSTGDYLSELISVDDDTIDIDDIIRQLGLEDFVDRNATDSFVPIPERILSIRFED